MITIISSLITRGNQTNKKNWLVLIWNSLCRIDNTPQYIAEGVMMIRGHPDICAGSVIRFSPGIKFKVRAFNKTHVDRIYIDVVSERPLYEFEIDEIKTHKTATIVRDSLYIEY